MNLANRIMDELHAADFCDMGRNVTEIAATLNARHGPVRETCKALVGQGLLETCVRTAQNNRRTLTYRLARTKRQAA